MLQRGMTTVTNLIGYASSIKNSASSLFYTPPKKENPRLEVKTEAVVPVDIRTELYSPENNNQDAFIALKIAEYKASRAQISGVYKTLSVLGGCAFIAKFYGAITGLGLLIAFYAYGDFCNPANAPKKSNAAREKLIELLEIYRWMTVKGTSVTRIKTFNDLLSTIAPDIVQTDDLIPYDFANNSPSVSNEFFKALENSPHALSNQVRRMIPGRCLNSTLTSDNQPKSFFDPIIPRFFKGTAFTRAMHSNAQLLFSYDSALEPVRPEMRKKLY